MSNPYYNVSGTPATSAAGSSSAIRAEYAAIAAGFALLADLTANRIPYNNSGGTAQTNNSGFTFDGTTFTAPATTITGLLTISGPSAGQIKFPATQNASSNANTLDDYAESTFTGTATGYASSPTDTVNVTKIGNQVTIQFQAGYSATSNATTKTITGMPAAIRPARDVYGQVGCNDNGAGGTSGQFVIGSNGTITVYPTAARGNWTNSGTANIDPICSTYQIA